MEQSFGTLADGRQAKVFTLVSGELELRVSDRGATMVSLITPGYDGTRADVVLGFERISGYEAADNPYMGATVGRFANRIAKGTFQIDGHRYVLARNEGSNHLHGGGARAFDKVLWDVVEQTADAVTFSYVSADGEEGYPGQVTAYARYRMAGHKLHLEFWATTDAPTPLNLTNHAYYNLRGADGGDVLDHELQVHAEAYTPTDDELIPTGRIAQVAGTPLDLREGRRLREGVEALRSTPAGGYDHNFVLDGEVGRLRPAARLFDPRSGRVLEVSTDQPAIQIYTGGGLGGVIGKRGVAYGPFSGMCLETQQFPDAVNHDTFPDAILTPGSEYRHHTVLHFSTDTPLAR